MCESLWRKLPPMLVVKGKTKKSLVWLHHNRCPQNTMWTFSDRACMDEELGEQWFKKVFLPNCRNERLNSPSLMGMGLMRRLVFLGTGRYSCPGTASTYDTFSPAVGQVSIWTFQQGIQYILFRFPLKKCPKHYQQVDLPLII